jgi:hypothetical protein
LKFSLSGVKNNGVIFSCLEVTNVKKDSSEMLKLESLVILTSENDTLRYGRKKPNGITISPFSFTPKFE